MPSLHSHSRHPPIMYNIVKRGHSCKNGYGVREVSDATQVGLFSKVMTYISEGGFIWIRKKVRESPLRPHSDAHPSSLLSPKQTAQKNFHNLLGLYCPVWLAFHYQFFALDRCRVSFFPHVSLSLLDSHFYTERTSADSASTWQESLKHLKASAPDARLAMFRMHFLTHAKARRWQIGWEWPQPPGL